jgi:hypothetical protein
MRICGDKRITRLFILPIMGERKGERIKRYGEEPKRGFRDKT